MKYGNPSTSPADFTIYPLGVTTSPVSHPNVGSSGDETLMYNMRLRRGSLSDIGFSLVAGVVLTAGASLVAGVVLFAGASLVLSEFRG